MPRLNGGEKKNAVADALPWEFLGYFCSLRFSFRFLHFSGWTHGLRTPREEIAFTARPKIQFQSQIFRYGRIIFCLPHWPKFSDFFDLYLHWVSLVRGHASTSPLKKVKIVISLNYFFNNVLSMLLSKCHARSQ